jgi:two-component system, OmpR family, sensor kinase
MPPATPPAEPPRPPRSQPLRRAARGRRRWSLRTRLLVASVSLIAVVCAVVGAVTTVALRQYLYDKLDASVLDVAMRAAHQPDALPGSGGPTGAPGGTGPGGTTGTSGGTGVAGQPTGPLGFVAAGGSGAGTLGAVLDARGRATYGTRSVATSTGTREVAPTGLTAAQLRAVSGVPRDRAAHTVDVPGLGAYRTMVVTDPDGVPIAVGLPEAPVRDTIGQLVVVTLLVTAAGLVAAALAGAATIRYALRPLRRVAATAGRVVELRLDRGEVAPLERVPAAYTDPGTEVGQVGAALNRLLGHVGSALAARQASETQVRQFVADASHELRTPLASIRGYAELTRRGPEELGPDARRSLGRIESEAARMTTLVEDLLLLARLDAGRPLAYEAVDLAPLVVDAVSDARAAGPDHHWRLALPDGPAVVRADPARLHQVLANLLANARTHTPPGTTVTARVVRDGAVAVVEVADTGPGIAPAVLPHVFERFARGDAARARPTDATDPASRTSRTERGGQGGGTGLGLAIARAVVVAHGGELGVRSVPGDTVFRVALPAADSQPVASLTTRS